jgi:DNA-binding NtrC family response regulator
VGEFLTVGRDLSNDLVLADEFTSVRHARLERKERGFMLRDLRSTNGTFVNGTRIFEAFLADGDRFRIGKTDLFFTSSRRAVSREFTSKNLVWNRALQRLPNIAAATFPVLLSGPSGAGKDVLARGIHALSPRRAGPLVSVNCSALTEALVESELFGHVRGSFTGATNDRKGAFEAARGGTLFLDEIGDLPLALQPKLLRALENNSIRPVGSDRDVTTDVRIVAATHHDLRRLITEGKFRTDLFFRLHVIQIAVPALRDRIEDFDDIFYEFARTLRVRFSFDAIAKMKEHSWPGNVRELRNVVARAKAFAGEDEVRPEDLEHLIDAMPGYTPAVAPPADYRPNRSIIKEIESEMIRTRLIANGGNQRRTAADLGMPKSTLHDRMKSYDIKIENLPTGYNA